MKDDWCLELISEILSSLIGKPVSEHLNFYSLNVSQHLNDYYNGQLHFWNNRLLLDRFIQC